MLTLKRAKTRAMVLRCGKSKMPFSSTGGQGTIADSIISRWGGKRGERERTRVRERERVLLFF